MTAHVQYLTPNDLRHRFNGGGYFERLQNGEFTQQITVVGPAPRRFPAAFESQMISYRDGAGLTVAIVHQYGFPNGDPAPGTRPDPKFLFEGGVRYKLSR